MPDSKSLLQSMHHDQFDLEKLAASLPETAQTMLVDIRLTDEPAASSRIFRVYSPVPRHYHTGCDEYLLVLKGRARFVVADEPEVELRPGQLQFFRRGVIHGFPAILEHPFLILSVDTPRREPGDVHFVDPAQGSTDSFIQTIPGY